MGLVNSAPTFAEAKQSSLTLSLSSNSLSVELTPHAEGTFGKSNSSTIRVRTDNFTGYNLIIKSDGDTALSNGAGGEIDSIESAVSESTYSTSGTYNNTWGYRPSQYMTGLNATPTVVENNSFLPVPGSLGDTIDITDAANSIDNTYTLDFGARVDYDTLPGVYTNSLTIIALANDVVYNINYDKNTAGTVNDMPTPNPQIVEIEGGTATAQSVAILSDTTPTRDDYTFSGWCDVATTVDSNTGDHTCSGNTYAAGDEYGVDQTVDGSNIRLYAIWTRSVYYVTLDRNCYTTATGSTFTTVTIGDTALGEIQAPTCADIISNRTVSNFNTNGRGADGATVTFPSSGNCTAANNCASSRTTTFTFNGWHETSDTGTLVASTGTTPQLQPSVSGYTDSSSRWIRDSDAALHAGWTISTGAFSQVTLPTITKSGYVCEWQKVNDASVVYESGATVVPGDNLALQGACYKNMQNIATSDLDSMMPDELDVATLNDSRDGNRYRVIKIGGRYWMAENLSLGGENAMLLTEEDTNLNDGLVHYALPASSNTGFSSETAQKVYNAGKGPCSSAQPCGGYYSFAAATAGTNPSTERATSDICPRGWRLPSLVESNHLGSVLHEQGISLDWPEYFNGALSGYYSGDSFVDGGVEGYLWTAFPHGGSTADTLSFVEDQQQGSVVDYSKARGQAIRCIKDITPTMQDQTVSSLAAAMPNEGDKATFKDDRDNKKYEITKINGDYWMTQNLRFTGTSLDPSTSNVASATTITYGNLTSGVSYDEARIHTGVDDNGDPTVWYNYAAASAMTVTGTFNDAYAAYDICPAGWRLPTTRETSGLRSYASVFNPVTGGYYDGTLKYPNLGSWWLSTTSPNVTSRYGLNWNGSDLWANYESRGFGFYVRCIKNVPTMQSQTASSLAAALPNEGDSAVYRDARDNKEYEVTKIDNQYWMTQNLRFTGTNLDPATSNVASNTTIAYGDLTSGSSYSDPRIHEGVDSNGDPTVWYNYAAASAGTITGDSNDTDAIYDICPAGWRLPTAGEISRATSYVNAFNPVAGGYYYSGLSNLDEGHWWSSFAPSATGRNILNWNGSILNTGYGASRLSGFYVRCVKSTPFMQAQTALSLAADMPNEGDSAVYRDARDNKEYEVTKIGNQYWMTQNLRFTGTNLDPATSNVASNTTITYGELAGHELIVFDEARIHEGVDDNGDPTVWYNFAAASAMTVTSDGGEIESKNAMYDICPAGWRLPYRNEMSDITSYVDAFKPVAGGYFYSDLEAPEYSGGWWASTGAGGTGADPEQGYWLEWYTDDQNLTVYRDTRLYGFYVRCVKDITPTMQEQTVSSLATVIPSGGYTAIFSDSRDGNKYEVAGRNGVYWMTQNLRFTGTNLDPATSNVASATTITYGDLTSGDSYDEARIHTGVDDNGDPAVWYNFAAASAMTVTGSSNNTDATYDICPAGWRLPTQSELSSLSFYRDHVLHSQFGGYYNNGMLVDAGYDYLWSATAFDATDRHNLYLPPESYLYSIGQSNRGNGLYVRCFKTS
ncbi:hypothetical protein J5491_01240 [Candidatus Saccharibacteria bacterium]|nr:hypothetical protein [Candidatus Saccharibacteria bacterium]